MDFGKYIMGSTSSGRYRTRNRGTIEGTPRIDVRDLRRLGMLEPGGVTRSKLEWYGGELTAFVTVDLTDEGRSLTVGWRGHQMRADIVSRPMRFGGERYYLICPFTRRRCEVLAIRGDLLASRQHLRLTYASQSEDRLARQHRAIRKLERREPTSRGANRIRINARLIARWEAVIASAGPIAERLHRRCMAAA